MSARVTKSSIYRWLRALRDCSVVVVPFDDPTLDLMDGAGIITRERGVVRLTSFGSDLAEAGAQGGWQ